MRALVTIAHYFKPDGSLPWTQGLGSGRAPLAKIAALNAAIVGLHRYFGPRRLSRNPDEPQARAVQDNTLDIVIITARGANLLDWIGIDPSIYDVEYFDGEPLMLPFDAQRIMRERAGGYDVYMAMEDDLIVDDPQMMAKIVWFAGEFGPRAVLCPVRYEMAYTGTPAKVAISPRLSRETRAPFQRPGVPRVLTGRWNGVEQSFCQPNNPHMGCTVLTADQLKLWIAHPTFYDRDASWVDSLVSAATHAPGKVFDFYIPSEPDPWFLGIEHYGTRYAAPLAPEGQAFGEPPLLKLAEELLGGGAAQSTASARLAALGVRADTINTVMAEAERMHYELNALKGSRSRLAKALLAALLNKTRRSR
ncbi:hypothetical protein [Rhodoplanes sp. Z2-YC6860]|uniref:hypothetical protein n=1 Tax=Rhodoplanes sp. Z2-YC6860 TaxID=674703 RepID=UPI00078E92A8|nr:hypothetical protein [Rhodoplanes sp. Z2-YC6860]AMN38662.1 hypothetical protein RHPLAN_01970 [Rhodoplanes sp. Z2-YC6860]